jgi:hypothetical protein
MLLEPAAPQLSSGCDDLAVVQQPAHDVGGDHWISTQIL